MRPARPSPLQPLCRLLVAVVPLLLVAGLIASQGHTRSAAAPAGHHGAQGSGRRHPAPAGRGSVGSELAGAFAFTPGSAGYLAAAADGTVTAGGSAHAAGGLGGHLDSPIVAAAASAQGGYWLADEDGTVTAFGGASALGSYPAADGPVAGMAAAPGGGGYWIVGSDGRVAAFGDAHAYGSARSGPITGIAATVDGRGYWLVTAAGRVLPFGDATFDGSAKSSGHPLTAVGIAAVPGGGGYWLAGSNGTVLAFGSADVYGAVPALTAAVVGIAPASASDGYYLEVASGQVIGLGQAPALAAPDALSTSVCDHNPTGHKLVEVDITSQQLQACDGPLLVGASPVTTGSASQSAGADATPVGTWAIAGLERNVHLSGCDRHGCFNDFAHYWLPFEGDYGFRDAPLQTIPFGSPDYAAAGTHGSVALPEAEAAWLLGWAAIGTKVVVAA